MGTGASKRQKNSNLVPSQDYEAKKAIQKLKDTKDLLEKKETHLENQISKEVANVKRSVNNQALALKALKKKKNLEKQLSQLRGTLTNIESQIEKLQESLVNKEVYKAMESGMASIKKVNENMGVGKVEKLMDEIDEQHELQRDLGDELARQNPANEFDEDDLLAELENYKQEGLEEKLLVGTSVNALPHVPTYSSPEKSEAKKDEEIHQLENWLST